MIYLRFGETLVEEWQSKREQEAGKYFLISAITCTELESYHSCTYNKNNL